MFDGKGRGQVAQNVVCPQTKMQRHLGLRVFCKQVDLSHYAFASRVELAFEKKFVSQKCRFQMITPHLTSPCSLIVFSISGLVPRVISEMEAWQWHLFRLVDEIDNGENVMKFTLS